MAQCPNCGRQLSCGCQRRVASNGVTVCTNCIAEYEAKIKNSGQRHFVPNQPPKQTTDPTNVKATFKL